MVKEVIPPFNILITTSWLKKYFLMRSIFFCFSSRHRFQYIFGSSIQLPEASIFVVIIRHLFCAMDYRIWKMQQELTSLLWLPLWTRGVLFGIQHCLVVAYITFFYEEDMVEIDIIKRCKNPTRRPITIHAKAFKIIILVQMLYVWLWCISLCDQPWQRRKCESITSR